MKSSAIQNFKEGVVLPEARKPQMSMTDQTLYCRDCNQEFTFTVGEQEFYASKGLTNAPTRCPDCRAARKRSGAGRRTSSNNFGGDYRDRQPRQMYSVTCAGCGNEASVPFQPRDDRPVYCQDCFQSQRSDRRSRW